jgi:hypothetical protein
MYRKLVKSSLAALLLTGASTAVLAQNVFTPGVLREDFFGGVSGGLDGFTGDARYPGSPDSTFWWNSFGPYNAGNNQGDNFGEIVSGYVIPPVTGNYKFYLRSDDPGELFISSDDKPANLGTDPIAIQSGCCNQFTDNEGTLSSTPIALTAGKKYYVQALHVEGGGDDYIQIAWRTPNDADLNTPPTSVIPAAYIGADAPSAGASVTITSQPKDTTATASSRATFTVGYTAKFNGTFKTSTQTQDANAANDASIVWFKNGVPIPGESAVTYTTPLLTSADNGATYTAQVSVPGAVAMSTGAKLTVTTDAVPPTITSIVSNPDGNTITLTFDGPVDQTTASAVANYKLSGGATVNTATISGTDSNIVTLATSQQTLGGTKYTLTVNNVKDTAGNVIAANTAKDVYTFILATGTALEKKWENISANNIAGLTNDTRFPANPSSVHTVTSWEWPPNGANEDGSNYGNTIEGWFIPPTTGDYVFFTCSDDPSALYLSTDDSPANKHLIAAEPSWNNPRQWVATSRRNADTPENRSDTYDSTEWPTGNKITLTAGKKYYMQSYHTEGGGGDNVGATFKLASEADPANGAAPRLTGAVIASYGNPNGFLVSTSPADQATSVLADAGVSAVYGTGLTALNSSNTKLKIDGTVVAATVATNSVTTTLSFKPSSIFAAGSKHTAELDYPLADGTPATATWSFTVENYPTITPAMQVKPDTSTKGFIWNYIQVADIGTEVQNSLKRTEDELAGKLGPNTGDKSVVGPASGPGTPNSNPNLPIKFTIPTVINLSIGATDPSAPANNGNFTPDQQEPGAPTDGSSTDNQAAEILTFIDLPAGYLKMGVNSDDDFATYVGQIGSITNLVGTFDGNGRGASDTIYGMVVQQAGTYAFRTIWENGGGGSNIEWFSEKPDGTKVLINDTANGGLKSYTAATANPGTGGGTGTISISGSGTSLKITFTGSIQSADSITGPWTDESGTSPLSVTASSKAKFYRNKP